MGANASSRSHGSCRQRVASYKLRIDAKCSRSSPAYLGRRTPAQGREFRSVNHRHVRVVHFEVRQLLRHLRPQCLLKKLHRLFWIGSAAASSSLFTERLAFSAILIALFLHSHVAILPKWPCSELLSPSRPAEELGGSYRKNQRLCTHLPSADRQEHS